MADRTPVNFTHPHDDLPELGISDRIQVWLGEHFGASTAMFWLAFVAPLLVIPLDNTFKLVLAVISGSWYQWWMLPVIQRSQMRADAKRDLKADADHKAILHIVAELEEIKDAIRD